jgi:cyclic pyranopterin phosphate synthase
MLSLPILDERPARPLFAQGPRSISAVKLLRISVTDRCNFRCIYCMPDEGVRFSHRDDLLSPADIAAVARAAVGVGVTHLKLTGGEPTVRADLLEIVESLADLAPADLSMTTNGVLLERIAADLRRAGLDRLTISWDTMRPDRFARIARGAARDGEKTLAQLRRGIDAAVAAGFERLKFNVVVVGGVNDDEAADFARLTLDNPWTVRFIEYMPLGDSTLVDASGSVEDIGSPFTVDNADLRAAIEAELGPLTRADRSSEPGVGPADVFTLAGARGRIGFISAMSQPFCESCNRLRLTATGELRACLFEGGEVNVLPVLRGLDDAPQRDQAIAELMRRCVAMKPDMHSNHGNRAMSQLGG